MTSPRVVLASFPLLSFLVVGCGGVTLDGGLLEPTPSQDDAGGRSPPSPHGDAAVTPPVRVDAGTPPKLDASPVPLPLDDASVPWPPDGAVGPCLRDSDCGAGSLCSFQVSEAACMSAQTPVGFCIQSGPMCNGIPETAVACGCGGHDVTWQFGCNGVPQTYAPSGVAHEGPCADAALPVVPCQVDAECPAGLQCGFAIDLSCGAQGQCVQPIALEGACLCDGVPVCACDGTTEYISCCVTYASKPVASKGACASDGGA